MELALIASAASASVFAIVGGYLYVRRRRMAKLGDYEMAKSRELLNRSEIELRPVVHTVSSSHSRFADINNIPTERTNASSLTTGRSVSRTQSHGSPNLPRMPAPILLPFSSASTLQQLPQYQRTITQSTYTGQLLPQTNRTKSDTRFRGTSGIGGRTSLMIDAQQGASPLPMLPSRTQQPDRRVSLLAQVVGDFQNRRSIAANNGGQIRMTSKTMRTNTVATSNTHRTQQTLVDHDDRGLQIPGFLQLNEATDYRVVESFASGGGGELFRGRMLAHSHSNLKVVIKRMLNSVSLPAFRQEVALIWLFNDNDHIVKLLGFNEMRLDIVMPEYTMGSLARFLDSENYSTKTAVSIALDVARGLAVMHERGIVHQDIKTDNILLEEHPKKIVHAVISDFGISNVVDNRVLTVRAFEVRNLRGLTIAYAAPEVIRRFRAKDRSLVAPRVAKAGDVYSFAIVLHAMVLRKEF